MPAPMNVMVVDDSRTNAYIVTRMLKEHGHQVFNARDAEEALMLLQAHPEIQLLIIDWVLPTMEGPELAQVVRARFPEPYRYLIMLTAKTGHDSMVQGLESGVDDYMTKPVDAAELKARMKIASRILELERALKRRLRQIEQVKREWEATTNALPQLICLVDPTGHVIHANQTAETWGLAALTAPDGVRIDELLRPAFPSFANQVNMRWPRMRARLAAGEPIDYEGADPATDHYFYMQAQPIRRQGNIRDTTYEEHTFAAVSIQDITERKRLEIELQEANEKSEQLLLNILPQPIAARLMQGEVTIAESFDDVTVLFADLVGFTRLTSAIPPAELMDLLNDVFSAFDYLSERYGLEKIKTIGDAYMVVGGLPMPRADHAHAIADMALDMLETIDHLNVEAGQSLALRIGIDSGPVVAGVIGRSKFIYDLWGDTVNTASRMESSGVAGHIQVTTATYDLLRADYAFEARGLIELKGKGLTDAFFLRGRN
ncbi:MAG: adenylate/guanylate cyclase domain-containing protein [Chloroflexota bacterium]